MAKPHVAPGATAAAIGVVTRAACGRAMGLLRIGRSLVLTALLATWAWQVPAQGERRSWLGVWVGNLANAEGAYVARVDAHGPAAAAAIRGGDLIVGVDAQTVRNTRELTCLLERRKPGDTVNIAVLRRSIRHTVEVRLGRWPDSAPPPARGDCGDAISGRARNVPAA
jgi:predicted metalloprotease with PDZ domain